VAIIRTNIIFEKSEERDVKTEEIKRAVDFRSIFNIKRMRRS